MEKNSDWWYDIFYKKAKIEKYTKKSVIYGSEVLSICNAIEDYSRKYPESEGYPKITAIIKIKADNIGLSNIKITGYDYLHIKESAEEITKIGEPLCPKDCE